MATQSPEILKAGDGRLTIITLSRTIISTGKEINMDTLSYTAFRQNLASVLDKVNADHTPIMITRQNGEPAIVMLVEDFKSYEETAYLMASPKNAKRLNEAIEQIEVGETVNSELM